MKANRALAMLRDWAETHRKIEEQCDALKSCLDFAPESPLIVTIWDCFEGYTTALAAATGISKDSLDHFRYECDMGRKPSVVEIDGNEITISTVDDLLKLL